MSSASCSCCALTSCSPGNGRVLVTATCSTSKPCECSALRTLLSISNTRSLYDASAASAASLSPWYQSKAHSRLPDGALASAASVRSTCVHGVYACVCSTNPENCAHHAFVERGARQPLGKRCVTPRTRHQPDAAALTHPITQCSSK